LDGPVHLACPANVIGSRANAALKTLIPAFSHERLRGAAKLGFGRSRRRRVGARWRASGAAGGDRYC